MHENTANADKQNKIYLETAALAAGLLGRHRGNYTRDEE
jgi:hypothetical protein